MTEQTYTWIAASIFCSQCEWHNRLSEIGAFMNNNEINTTCLQFNYQQHENIRWGLYAPANQAAYLKTEIDGQINNVQYGLYNPLYAPLGIQSQLSWLMLDLFANNEIDDETLLSTAFQLQLALMKLVLARGFVSLSALHNIHNDNSIFEYILRRSREFNHNREAIFEMAHGVIDDDLPPALEQWVQLCEAAFESTAPDIYKDSHLVTYKRLIYQVQKQLGISTRMETLLYEFVYHIIRSSILDGLIRYTI